MQELEIYNILFLSCGVFFARSVLYLIYANRATDMAYELSIDDVKKGLSNGLSYFELAGVSVKSIFLFSISINKWSFKSAFPGLVEAQRRRQ